MTRRTTGLAGTFALLCVAHLAAAQNYAHPRIGMVTAASGSHVGQPGWTAASAQRAVVRPQGGNRPRIGLIMAAPVQPQTPMWEGQAAAPRQAAAEVGLQVDPRRRQYPGTVLPGQLVASAPRATPRGYSTTRGTAPRIGLIIPGPPAAQGQFSPTIFSQSQSAGFVQVAQFFYVPAVVLTDGRVFANFNGSYEQVLRQCPAISDPLSQNISTTTACWMIDPYGRYVVVQPRW